MRTTTLGPTTRPITRIGLGAMPLSLADRPDREAAKAVVRAAIEAEVTLIDTADVYCIDETDYGHNEALIAEALAEAGLSAEHTEDGSGGPLVATKGGRSRPGGAWGHAARPEQLRSACEASLRALGVECIGLYQLHTPDPEVPFADSVGALSLLRDEGKVAHVGLSNVTVAQIEEARGIVPIVSVQNLYNPWTATGRRSTVIEYCEREGITFMAYSPVGGSGRAAALGASEALRTIGEDLGSATPWQLALAYLMSISPVVVPIPGASRPESIRSSAAAGALELDEATLGRVRAAFGELPGQEGLAGRILGRVKRIFGG